MSAIKFVAVDLPLAMYVPTHSIITTCTDQSATIKKCPAYASTPGVQAAVTDMDTAVSTLGDIVQKLVQAQADVKTYEGQRDKQEITLRIKHSNVESALNNAAGGDPVQALAWTGKTKERAKPLPIGSSNLPPEDAKVRNVKAHPGMILASCAKEQSAVSYAFQMGTDQAHPETWPAQVVTSGHTYKVGNLPIGQVVYLRIAVVRRGSIQGAWSAIMPIQIR
jgi:hypothetical protein